MVPLGSSYFTVPGRATAPAVRSDDVGAVGESRHSADVPDKEEQAEQNQRYRAEQQQCCSDADRGSDRPR